MSLVAPTLQGWFTRRLIAEQQVSPHTINAYRDTIRLLFLHLDDKHNTPPSLLDFNDLDATVIGEFLTWLETNRNVSVATRNARLAAIRSFFGYASFHHPEHAALIARVLAIPSKKAPEPIVTFLTPPEIDALINAPNIDTWIGRRDQCMLTVGIQTGLRVSELIGLQPTHLSSGPAATCAASARAARKEQCRSTRTHRKRSAAGSTNTQRAPCSVGATDSRSAAMLSAAFSLDTPTPQHEPAQGSSPRMSPHTS